MDRSTPPEKTRGNGDNGLSKARAKPAIQIHIPELYRFPVRDRDTQGCMKARA